MGGDDIRRWVPVVARLCSVGVRRKYCLKGKARECVGLIIRQDLETLACASGL